MGGGPLKQLMTSFAHAGYVSRRVGQAEQACAGPPLQFGGPAIATRACPTLPISGPQASVPAQSWPPAAPDQTRAVRRWNSGAPARSAAPPESTADGGGPPGDRPARRFRIAASVELGALHRNYAVPFFRHTAEKGPPRHDPDDVVIVRPAGVRGAQHHRENRAVGGQRIDAGRRRQQVLVAEKAGIGQRQLRSQLQHHLGQLDQSPARVRASLRWQTCCRGAACRSSRPV